MNNLASIYLLPEVVEEGTELWDMKQRFKGAIHDDSNILFPDVHPNAVDPILTTDMVDEEGNELHGDDLVPVLAKILFSTDRDRAVHMPRSDAFALHRHPAWKLWCGKYEDKDALEADHEAVFKVGVDRRKNIETLVDESRANLKAALA